MMVALESVNSQRHGETLGSYHLPEVPKTQCIVKSVIFKVVPNVKLLQVLICAMVLFN